MSAQPLLHLHASKRLWSDRSLGYSAGICLRLRGRVFRYVNSFMDSTPNISLGDPAAGFRAAFGTVLALLARQKNNGKGSIVGVSTIERWGRRLSDSLEYRSRRKLAPNLFSGCVLTLLLFLGRSTMPLQAILRNYASPSASGYYYDGKIL